MRPSLQTLPDRRFKFQEHRTNPHLLSGDVVAVQRHVVLRDRVRARVAHRRAEGAERVRAEDAAVRRRVARGRRFHRSGVDGPLHHGLHGRTAELGFNPDALETMR